jgi:hypothetical protein
MDTKVRRVIPIAQFLNLKSCVFEIKRRKMAMRRIFSYSRTLFLILPDNRIT